jgi:UDP-N-acetylglucosamine 2-epimerase (non-hydrolysing)
MKVRIHLVAGARPNFMKIGPVYHELVKTDWAEPVIVHTGQHFSAEMSDVFFRDLKLPTPHYHLDAKGNTHAQQTAAVLTAYEALCEAERPDWTIVVGDVNSTLAACLAARKLHIPVAHLEAGLRSGDRTMPEEINRLAVDAISDLLWTPSADADSNLEREGVQPARIQRVGNVMIDAFCLLEDAIRSAGLPERLGLRRFNYVVVTLHRPANVDNERTLAEAVGQLVELAGHVPVVFPVHPRTRKKLLEHDLWKNLEKAGIALLEPLSYVEFMSLVEGCGAVVTDSGGVQEETSYLGIPCLTARDSTERPITLELGTNRLIPLDAIFAAALAALNNERPMCTIPMWDGRAAARIVASLRAHIGDGSRQA